MVDPPLFSVITANFNSGDKLLASVASVLSQGVATEYLILDGVSTDGSLALAQQLQKQSPQKVRLISKPDLGIYDAMNKGICVAKGRYIFFLGAGDTLEPGVLRKIAPELPSHNLGFIYGDVLMNHRRYDGPFDRKKIASENICHQSIFYGRQIFTLCGQYDTSYPVLADWVLNIGCFADDRVEKKYVNVICATFEGGGISSQENCDAVWIPFVVARSFGLWWYARNKRAIAGSWTGAIGRILQNRMLSYFRKKNLRK